MNRNLIERARETRTINLIPDNYGGDPHEAMGYCWEKLEMDSKYRVDVEQSIPGEDWHGVDSDEALDRLESEYGPVAIRNDDSYGWLKNVAETRDGKELDISECAKLATINKMWCGGRNLSVYLAADAKEMPKKEPKPKKRVGSAPHSELCPRCETYCYGDCEA